MNDFDDWFGYFVTVEDDVVFEKVDILERLVLL